MTQTPAQDSPIFNQLNSEFAAEGKAYEELVYWSVPEFVPWRPVVQLDRQSRRGVNIKKHIRRGSHCSCGVVWPCTIGAETETDKMLRDEVARKLLSPPDSDSLLQEYVARVGREFAAHHPLAVVTDMHTEMNNDGSATVIFEAVQPITSVLPLSEKDAANPME